MFKFTSKNCIAVTPLASLFLITQILCAVSQADKFNVPNDDSYFTYDSGSYRFIYTAKERPLINELLISNDQIRERYQHDFGWNFDQTATVFLLSTRNQIANGFATTFPQLETVFYSGGAQWPDEFSARSWSSILLAHETSHLYQLNAKQGYGRWLHRVTHNAQLSGLSFLPPFTYTEYPNVFLPTFLLEGNATYNEGRSGNGGRLYNGFIRATFLQLAKADLINSRRLMNDHLDFPRTSEKYWVGGFLQASLAEDFGTEKVDHFFVQHADNYFNPFKVNEAFLKTFGIGYEEAIAKLNEKWRPLFSTLKSIPEPALFSSFDRGWLTKDAREIRVLTNDGFSDPVAHIYNLRSHDWSSERLHLPMGKLFRLNDGRWVATSAENVDNQNILAGLFEPGLSDVPEKRNRYYYDIQGSHELYADATASYREPLLVADGQKIGPAHSSAIFGADAEPYFFRQIGKTRTLYRRNNAIFSYQGYYGFPIEVSENGDIYFIGPVERGSSLFVYRRGQFKRLTPSDVVVDAKIITPENAIVTEVTAKGFEYKLVGLSATDERPFDYQYPFEKDSFYKTFSTPQTLATFDLNNEKAYRPIHEIRYDGLDLDFLSSSQQGIIGSVGVRASDPLQNHSFSVVGTSSDFGAGAGLFSYLNQEYAAAWQVLASYQRVAVLSGQVDSSGHEIVSDRYNSWVATTGFNYPLFRRPELTVSLIPYFVYQYDAPHILLTDVAQTYSMLTRLVVEDTDTPPLAFSSYRHLNIELAHNNAHDAPTWQNQRNIFAAQVTAQYDVYRQTYLSGSIQESVTDGSLAAVQLRESVDKFPLPSATIVYRLTPYTDQLYFAVRKETIQLKQGFNQGFYFTKFPLSLRRFAAIGAYNQYEGALTAHREPATLFNETVLGGEFELLLVHKFPFRITAVNALSNYDHKNQTVITVGTNANW